MRRVKCIVHQWYSMSFSALICSSPLVLFSLYMDFFSNSFFLLCYLTCPCCHSNFHLFTSLILLIHSQTKDTRYYNVLWPVVKATFGWHACYSTLPLGWSFDVDFPLCHQKSSGSSLLITFTSTSVYLKVNLTLKSPIAAPFSNCYPLGGQVYFHIMG